jgi:NitT/TauT family transport system substrate-binding protein
MGWKLIVLLFVTILGALFVGGCTERGDEDSLYVIKMSPANMIEQLKLGEIDGFIAWEPYNAEAVEGGYGKYLIHSRDIWPDHPCCILAYREGANLDENTLKALVWAHIKATQFIQNPANHEKVVKYAVEFTGKEEAVVREALKDIDFVFYPESEEFRNYYKKLADAGILNKDLQDLGYKSEDEFFSDFLMEEYYNEVMKKLKEDPSWKPGPVSETVRIGFLTADLHELAIYIAQKEGYYEDVGLVLGKNLIIKQYANGVYAMEGFKAEEIDVSYLGGAPATLKRINDNIQIHVIGGANNVGSSVVVARDSGINSIEDLKGKTIAIPGFGTVQDFLLRMVAEKANLKIVVKE